MNTQCDSAFFEIEKVINGHLFGAPDYRDKTGWTALCRPEYVELNGRRLVSEAFAQVKKNLSARHSDLSRSTWTFRKLGDRRKAATDYEEGREVALERAIVRNAPDRFTYQMPVASGLFERDDDGKRRAIGTRHAIDLVYDRGEQRFDFIELKVDADTPLYAAMEILGYGLVYLAVHSDEKLRTRLASTTPNVMLATDVQLCVLAPRAYYDEWSASKLRWLAGSLDDGLRKLTERLRSRGLTMGFRFETFSEGFRLAPFAWAERVAF